MSEILLVGSNGAPGGSKELPSRQLRVSWYVADGDTPAAVLLDSGGRIVDRYPGVCPGVSADGPLWLVDLPALPAHVTRVELSVTFRTSGDAGFEAMIGDRALSHPGATGQPGQERLLTRLTRTTTGWSLVPFDRPVDAVAVGGSTVAAPPPPIAGAPTPGRPAPVTPDVPAPAATSARTGRLVVVVDASGSMLTPLRSGAVATVVLEAVQTTGRPEVLLRAAGGVRGATHLGATTVSADITDFCTALTDGARYTRSGVTDALADVDIEPEDEVVVVSDAPPADLGAALDALAGRNARWIVVGAAALVGFGPDRRRLESLTTAGVRVRTFATR